MRSLARFFVFLAAVLILVPSCKKAVQKKHEDLLIMLIVSSQWVVTKYTKGTEDLTADFSPYAFQFKDDFTVEAIINNIVEKTGTWNGSLATKTIQSNFPNPNPILALLNGTWLVTDSGLDYVESTQTINGEKHFLRLVKK